MFLQQSFASLRQSFEAGDLASVGQQLPPLKVRPRSISFPTLPSTCSCNICSEARRAILQTWLTLPIYSVFVLQLLLTQSGLLFPTGQATSVDDLVTARAS